MREQDALNYQDYHTRWTEAESRLIPTALNELPRRPSQVQRSASGQRDPSRPQPQPTLMPNLISPASASNLRQVTRCPIGPTWWRSERAQGSPSIPGRSR